jgi:deoxycytidylate deaminase
MEFIITAGFISRLSNDPVKKVGCVIVDTNNKLVSTGCNKFIADCDNSYMTFEK